LDAAAQAGRKRQGRDHRQEDRKAQAVTRFAQPRASPVLRD
jgi:hypothetical protein